MIELLIRQSRGRTSDGKMNVMILPDCRCFNKARFVSGYTNAEVNEKIEKIKEQWYAPEMRSYKVDKYIIVSNSEKNALKEYWRVCDRNDIGKIFEVTCLKPIPQV